MDNTTKQCLVCGRDSNEVPLLTLTYQDKTLYICPTDLPIAIHKPERLVGKLPGAEQLSGAGHEH